SRTTKGVSIQIRHTRKTGKKLSAILLSAIHTDQAMQFTAVLKIATFATLLATLVAPGETVSCYVCDGQCSPYSKADSNVSIITGCMSCKYVVAYGGFGDLATVEDVSMPACSTTRCSNGDEDAYPFQYLFNSYVYTLPAYSTCCNSDLCNIRSGSGAVCPPALWLLALVAATASALLSDLGRGVMSQY
ncbi:hypothetical protein BOX15_Mlig031939g1, partial [Macrostomum lignano]